MSFLNKGRAVAAIEEASFGAGGTFVDSDYIDYTSCDISTDIQQLERAVVRNSLVPLESALGQETSSGSVAVEISPTNTTGTALNGDLLLKNGIGRKLGYVGGLTVASATDESTFDISDAAGLEVGHIIKVKVGGATEEITSITGISGTTLTVAPALSATPSANDPVAAMLTYIFPRPADAVPSLAIREHLEDTTGATRINYDYKGVMVTSVALAYPVGQICTATFNTSGADFDVTTGASAISLSCDMLSPVIGKNAKFTYYPATGAAVDYAGQDVNINVETSTANIESITTGGISNILGVGKTGKGSFKTEYVGVDNFTRFKQGDTGALSIELNVGGASDPMVTGVFAPYIRFTKVTRSEDNGLFYDNVEFETLSPSCDGNERAISVWFGPNAAL